MEQLIVKQIHNEYSQIREALSNLTVILQELNDLNQPEKQAIYMRIVGARDELDKAITEILPVAFFSNFGECPLET